MVFTAGSALLDAVVLSVVSLEGTYGYKITQDVREIMEVSESTLYPVLRRLQKDNYLETYDMEFQGRNRRYYKITSNGMILLDQYRREWASFKSGVDKILLGIEKDGENFLDQFLEEPKLVVFVSYNLDLASEEGLNKLNEVSKLAKEKGYQVIGMTATNNETIANYKAKYKFDFDFYFCDATTLKTIERGNPSLVVLEYGTIVQKLHWNDATKITLK